MADNGLNRRQFLRKAGMAGAATVAFPSLLAACADDGDTGGGGGPVTEPLKIGFLNTVTGVFAVVGKQMDQGFRLYLEQNGGELGGRPVELIVEDEEAIPEVALRKAQKLVRQDQVHIVIGVISSASALAVRDFFHENQVPLIISNAAANDVTREAFSPYIFRTSYANYQANFPAGKWVYDNVANNDMYIMATDYVAGHEHVGGFVEGYTQAGGEILDEAFPPFQTTTDYQPFLSALEGSGAKGVYVFFAGGEAITFVKQYDQFGLKEQIPLLGNGAITEAVLPAQGRAALGVRSCFLYAETVDNPVNNEFRPAYEEAYDETPTVFSVQNYDTAIMIDKALQSVDGNTDDVEALLDAFENVGTIESPSGDWTLDENHNPVRRWYMRDVVESGGTLEHNVIADLGMFGDPGS